MSKSKYTVPVCAAIVALTVALTVLLMCGNALGIEAKTVEYGYATRLFDTSRVHAIDIVIDEADWNKLIENAADEEYQLATLVIDGDKIANVGIRAKGNTSLSSVANYGNDRYSLKIEFDHYVDGKNYYGLDKLALNNNIQDNTLMKDYLTYRMMAEMGVAAPLVSYAWVTVNGSDWGLYLAVEGVEESFLERNYGSDYGELYKPDSISMGGGRGNGGDFNIEDFANDAGITLPEGFSASDGDGAASKPDAANGDTPMQSPPSGTGQMTPPSGASGGFSGTAPDMPDNGGNGGGGSVMGADDVSLIYSDDDYASYSDIFDNAKTALTSADKNRLIAALKRLNEQSALEDTVDIDGVIKYFVVHNFVVNFDSYTGSMIHNYYLYEKDGVLSMIPWDYNLAFGGFTGGTDATALVNYPVDTPVSGGTVQSRPMLAWIFSSEEYTALYHEYFADFLDFFDSGSFEALFDETVSLISPYAQRDTDGFCTYDEFLTGTATLREFCLKRAQSVEAQLEGAIPSTEDGQNADSSALIDASDLSVSDMGSMGNMGGGSAGGDAGGMGGGSAGGGMGGGTMPGGGFSGGAPGAQQGAFPQASPSATP